MAERQVPTPVRELLLKRTTSQSVIAPEINRTVVKLAGSMLACRSAKRHSSELPANAIMASDVNATTRTNDITVSVPAAECVSVKLKTRRQVRPANALRNLPAPLAQFPPCQ